MFFALKEYYLLKKIFTMNEILKLSSCILGAIFLFIGIVSLINTQPELFFFSLPVNLLFIIWFQYQLTKKY